MKRPVSPLAAPPTRLSAVAIAVVAALAAAGAILPATAATLSGSVVDAHGAPMFGAMVTLRNTQGFSETVYTDAAGRWRLGTGQQGALSLRARAYRHADQLQPLMVGDQDLGSLTLRLMPLTEPASLSEALPASAHAATLRWQDAGTRESFVSQCMFCHQIGNALTRKPRTSAEWTDVIARMQSYGALITHDNERHFPLVLSETFDGMPVQAVLTPDATPELARLTLREWAFGGPLNYVHDIEIGRAGLIYGVDMSSDDIWILDPRTNAIESIRMPPNELPLGGMFAGAVSPLGTFAAHHGPHSIIEGPDGRMYITCSLGGEIGIFDPATAAMEFVKIGGDAVYPHTLRFDRQGTLWFTLALSNQIGRMDIYTRRIDIIDLPSNGFWRWLTDAMLPSIMRVAAWFPRSDLQLALSHHKPSGQGHRIFNLPYGIDINPIDGSIWYTKLYSSYIGRVDPLTLEVKEFPTPHKGPRRARFAADGTLWIPSFEEGYLMRFDTRSQTWVRSYRLPTLAADQQETPYALNVHPRDGAVWITSNQSDRLFRFDPQSGRYTSIPTPTRVNFMRDIVFTDDGRICTSNSNLPAAAIEGGRPTLICIEDNLSREP